MSRIVWIRFALVLSRLGTPRFWQGGVGCCGETSWRVGGAACGVKSLLLGGKALSVFIVNTYQGLPIFRYRLLLCPCL